VKAGMVQKYGVEMGFLNKIFVFLNKSKMNELGNIPGPPPSFPLGNLSMLLGQQPWFVTASLAENYGPISVLWFASSPQIVINSPELFKDVLISDWLEYYKVSPVKQLGPVITKYTPFIANMPSWKQMRANNPFSSEWFPNWLKAQVNVFLSFSELRNRELVQASKSKSIDLTENLQRYSFDAFSLAVGGKLFPDEVYNLFTSLGNTGSKRLTNPLILSFVLNPFFYLKRKKWFKYFENLLDFSANNPNSQGTDIINWGTIKGVHLEGQSLTANTADIFYGGVYSVASSLATTIWLLSQKENKVYEEKLISEIKTFLSKKKTITEESLSELKYLEKVLREAMRIFPAVPFFSRNSSTVNYVFLGEHKIPKNTSILISNYAMHHDASHWKDPLKFNPDRWTDEVMEKNPYGSGYFFPFGQGPRACMGMPFALLYLRTAILGFYKGFKFVPDSNSSYTQGFHFGVMMPSGLKGQVIPLDNSNK
jgi:hypothetical protein